MGDYYIGATATGEIAVGLVKDHALAGELRTFGAASSSSEGGSDVHSMPMDAISETIAQLVKDAASGETGPPAAVGIGLPGIIRDGMIEESPNLRQAKGTNISEKVTRALASKGIETRVFAYNDADVTAAGIAASRGYLEKLIRVWTLGHGVGFGLYPHRPGIWEGGHMVVSLDPKEVYCGCGGQGHLEGIMGRRAMRQRFLDLEPEEVFANAQAGDARCAEFELRWHRALAAATSSVVHMGGPGKFFITGSNAKFVRVNLLNELLHSMVTMTTLQGTVFEVVTTNREIAVVGSAVNASQAAA